MIRSIVVVVLLMIMSQLVFAAEMRTWTDKTGKHKQVAEFVSLKNGKLLLRKENGKKISLAISQLSKADQKVAKDLAKKAASSSKKTQSSSRFKSPSLVNSVRAAPLRSNSMQNLRQVGIALNNYVSAMGRFPTQSTNKRDSKKGLSWRVAILPYLDENVLYGKFNKNEPWDSPTNIKLLRQMPSVFKSPGGSDEPGITNYLAVVSDRSIIVNGKRGSRMQDIRDGTSRTLLVVEADDSEAVEWTKPDDLEWDYDNPAQGLGGIWPGGQFLGVFADGHTQRLSVTIGNDGLIGIFTRNGGERVNLDN